MDARKCRVTAVVNGTKQFLIPVFQRDYNWTEDHCEQLWADILRISESPGESSHFPILSASSDGLLSPTSVWPLEPFSSEVVGPHDAGRMKLPCASILTGWGPVTGVGTTGGTSLFEWIRCLSAWPSSACFLLRRAFTLGAKVCRCTPPSVVALGRCGICG